ncbi:MULTISPECIES: LysR family transcriptional regulator [unclassified Caballeronia]|uniref:LysR family transcriptional regulator n=1 Tax=unclassified Caballeronia TaxID=2646786 RepID=UPI0028633467|nr:MULTISPECIES: LysR family transcriptional regulator [unclassified Caballeronia]MDR5774561.1 LysR family transcriptional regulator [Caballeronia sp. LZ002]MDR5849997.1 LysR family transcriptional regulator [Caballeronia sp. LZ003]
MELRHIRYFLAVAEELNVTRAAERLGIGQPPLSQQIHALEDEIGVRLFRRTGHGVVLTEAGEAFAADARRILNDTRIAVENAQSAGRGEMGQLNIGFTGSAAFNPVVSQLIRAYRQAFPNVTLTLAEGNTAQLLAYLDAGTVDVAFVRLGSQSPAGVEFHHIAVEPMRVVLPGTHRLAKKKKIALSALAEDPFVMLPRVASPTLHDVIVGACREAGFEPVAGQQAPQLSSVVNLVAAEFGVSLVPASVCQIQVEGVVYADMTGKAVSIRLALASRIEATQAKTANFLDMALGFAQV